MVDPETIIDGRYRVVSRLGSGGMADVYLAEDQLLGRQVAVKVLHPALRRGPGVRRALPPRGLERRASVASEHRRDLRPGEWNGTYYIAMEYVAGRSLKTIVREQGALTPATAIDIVIQILRAARLRNARRDPPRPQAAQRDHRRGGPRTRHRLRHRAGRRVGHDDDRLDHGHRAVPVARAGPGPAVTARLGPLLGRRDPLRAADRRGAVRGRDGCRDRFQARLGRAAPPSS